MPSPPQNSNVALGNETLRGVIMNSILGSPLLFQAASLPTEGLAWACIAYLLPVYVQSTQARRQQSRQHAQQCIINRKWWQPNPAVHLAGLPNREARIYCKIAYKFSCLREGGKIAKSVTPIFEVAWISHIALRNLKRRFTFKDIMLWPPWSYLYCNTKETENNDRGCSWAEKRPSFFVVNIMLHLTGLH